MSTKTQVSDKVYWRNVPGITMVWHGSSIDPELTMKHRFYTVTANYWDVEDYLYNCAKEELGEAAQQEEQFDQFVNDNHKLVVSIIKEFGRWQKAV